MPPRIVPVRRAPAPDAFQREFGEPETRPYCGAKTPIPRGKRLATPNYCYKAGLRSGYAAASQKGEEKVAKAVKQTKETAIKKVKVVSQLVPKITKAASKVAVSRTKKSALIEGAMTERLKTIQKIKTSPLSLLKHIPLTDMTLGMMKAIGKRYVGTAQRIPDYGSLTIGPFARELELRGFKW